MGREIQPGDTCARCGQTVELKHAETGTIDSTFDAQIGHLSCGCLAAPTLDDD